MIITPHPVLKVPTREQALAMGERALRELLEKREALIRLEKEDPYRGACRLESWTDASKILEDSLLLANFGGNGSAKTHFMCLTGVETLVEKPGSKVLWLHEAEKPSILLHHATVWHYLPKELKVPSTKRQRVTNINYTVKTGFSDGKLVLPNGSIGVFGAYKQDIADYEGTGWTLICADENMPLAWLKTLLYRLPRCGGRMIWGFTPIRGITPAVRHVVQGATTTVSRKAELLDQNMRHVDDCPPGHMPYIQRAVWPRTNIIYFFSEMNPFGGYEDFKKILHGRTKTEIEQRAYGYARNTIGNCFPKFSAVHIIPEAKMDEILQGPVTRRHYGDPAGARNMFQIWTATDPDGRHFVTDEWPDVPTFGEWAVTAEDSNRWDGMPGPAQPSLGLGAAGYKRVALELEGNKFANGEWDMCGVKIFERKLDPRSGVAGHLTEQEGGVSMIDMMFDEQRTSEGLVGPSMIFEQAKGLSEDQGIMRINDLLDYNANEPVCPHLNEPKLYISSRCQNLIWALQTYTRHDGEKAACKDPIDCLRYFVTDDAEYIDPKAMQTRGGGHY